MQQPAYQQEQSGSQEQVGQQMVLCPVRLVYETQMLVQPGDQIQPNQTIIINPQNPPPWIQNRPVQNQVIYVQHVPTNYAASTQQHIDQNQFYIQNYGFQNVPQMYLQNPREQIRPLHMVPNIMSNMQPTISAMQNPRMISNVAPVQNSLNIVNAAQNQNIVVNRQIAPNQINYNELINKSQETITQNIYRNPVPQSIQQEPRFPQNITMVPNSIPAVQRVPQNHEPNMNHLRPAQQNVQQVYPNTVFNIEERGKLTPPSKGNNLNIVNPVGNPRNSSQAYKPIQPRTNQGRSNAPNLPPTLPTPQSRDVAQSTLLNTVNLNHVPRNMQINSSMSVTNNVNNVLTNVKVEGNSMLFNRKRKSESPDEIHKKISICNQVENSAAIKQIQNVTYTNCADVGVNTSPIHKASGRLTINSLQITPLSPNAPNSKLKEELAKPLRTNPPVTETHNIVKNMINIVPSETAIDNSSADKEKLVRNTVYVQARGRVLTDKETVPEKTKVDGSENSSETILNSAQLDRQGVLENNETKQSEKKVNNDALRDQGNIVDMKYESKNALGDQGNLVDMKYESKKTEEIESPADLKIREDKGFILTHVLGGFVIQESNVAFPIRRPLKEKTLHCNMEIQKKENRDLSSDRHLTNDIKDNSKILNISHLNLQECENMEDCSDICKMVNENENPFKLLQPSNVKSWTADQLAAHLSKFEWNETTAVLQEHELDGESLLLVSKGQLLTIGVKEEHADIISEFIKS